MSALETFLAKYGQKKPAPKVLKAGLASLAGMGVAGTGTMLHHILTKDKENADG